MSLNRYNSHKKTTSKRSGLPRRGKCGVKNVSVSSED